MRAYPIGVRPHPPVGASATDSHERTDGRTDGERGYLPERHVALVNAHANRQNREMCRWGDDAA